MKQSDLPGFGAAKPKRFGGKHHADKVIPVGASADLIDSIIKGEVTTALTPVRMVPTPTAPPVVAIDPGQSGGLGILADDWIEAHRLPVETSTGVALPDVRALRALLERAVIVGCQVLYIEDQPNVKRDGRVGSATKHKAYGKLLTVAEVCGLRVVEVAPATWMARMLPGTWRGTGRVNKKPSTTLVPQMWPAHAKYLPRDSKGAVLDGPTDAVLLCEFGRICELGLLTP